MNQNILLFNVYIFFFYEIVSRNFLIEVSTLNLYYEIVLIEIISIIVNRVITQHFNGIPHKFKCDILRHILLKYINYNF